MIYPRGVPPFLSLPCFRPPHSPPFPEFTNAAPKKRSVEREKLAPWSWCGKKPRRRRNSSFTRIRKAIPSSEDLFRGPKKRGSGGEVGALELWEVSPFFSPRRFGPFPRVLLCGFPEVWFLFHGFLFACTRQPTLAMICTGKCKGCCKRLQSL